MNAERNKTTAGKENAPSVQPPVTSQVPRLRSVDLFTGGTEVLIEHQGREYRLRLTRNGKLILTA